MKTTTNKWKAKLEKWLGILILAFSLQPLAFSPAFAQLHVMVVTDTNGNLVAPTNLFSQNSNLLNQSVSSGGGGGGGVTSTFDPAWFSAGGAGTNALPLSNHLASLSATLSTNATNFAKTVGQNATNTFLAASGGIGIGNTFTNPLIQGTLLLTNNGAQVLNVQTGQFNFPDITDFPIGLFDGGGNQLFQFSGSAFTLSEGSLQFWSGYGGAGNESAFISGADGSGELATSNIQWSAAGQLTLSNLTASEMAGTDAGKHLVSVAIGSGLSLSGGTLSATGGGGSASTFDPAWFSAASAGTNALPLSNHLATLSATLSTNATNFAKAVGQNATNTFLAASGGSGTGNTFTNPLLQGTLLLTNNGTQVLNVQTGQFNFPDITDFPIGLFDGGGNQLFQFSGSTFTLSEGSLQFWSGYADSGTMTAKVNGSDGSGELATSNIQWSAAGQLTLSNLTASQPVFTDANKKLVSVATIPANNIPSLAGTTNLNHFALTNLPQINEPFQETSSGLPAGWTYASGGGSTGTAARNGSGLLLTNNTGYPAYNWVYYTNLYNASHNYHIHCDFSVLMTNGNANVFMFGTKSGNPNDDSSSVLFFYPMPGAYCGTMGLYNGSSVTIATNRNDDTLASSTTYPNSVALGTYYGLDLQVDDDSFSAVASNKTTGQLSTFAWKQDVSTSGVTNGYFGSSGYFGINIFGGSYLITNFTVTLNVPRKIDCLIWGDSIAGTGARGADFESGWACRVRQGLASLGLSTVIYGCGSDGSVQSSNELAQVLSLPAPALALFAAGGNDLGFGVTSYTTNLPAIKTALSPANVAWVAPTARGANDESSVAYWMLTNNPAAFIDAFSATKASEAYSTLPSYVNPYDAIHPDEEGHVAVYAVVRNWLRQNGYAVP